jgi:hypothetical protein
MARLLEKRPRPKVPASLHQSFLAAPAITALATVHRDFRICSAEVGNRVRVSSLCEKRPLRGPLSHVWVPMFLSFFFLLFFLFRIFVVVFASAPASVPISSPSLSHYYHSRSLYFSIFSVPLPSNVSAKKQRQVQS